MKKRVTSMHGLIISLLLLFLCNTAFSQNDNSSTKLAMFQTLEANIRNNKELTQTTQSLKKLQADAISSKDDISHARSLYNLLQIRDKQTEDSLYFQNSAFMDTLIENRTSSSTLKALIHLLRAQRIAGFAQHNLRFNIAAYRSSKLKIDYAALTYKQRAEMVDHDYASALKYSVVIGSYSTLSWMPVDPEALVFSASLEDVLRAAQIAWLKQRYNEDQWPSLRHITFLMLPSPAFRNKLDSLSSKADQQHPSALLAYRSWIHASRNNPEKSTFVEALARQHIFVSTVSDSTHKEDYIKWLQINSTSKFQSVKLHAIYQLCMIWNEQGNEFSANARFQYQRKKALDLYEKHAQEFKKYPVYEEPLADMARQIRAAGVQVVLEDKQTPNQQIPIQVSYKNANALYYRGIRIAAANGVDKLNAKLNRAWLNASPVAEGSVMLPLPDDHQLHNAKLHLPEMPVGWYGLIFGKQDISNDTANLNAISFQVTSIAAINDDNKVFVLDRTTGVPLTGAKVQYVQQVGKGNRTGAFRVEKDGHVDLSGQPAERLLISYHGDTLRYSFYNDPYRRLRNEVDQDGAEDLSAFYMENLSMEILTDRSIYRPGQSLQYKVILMTRHPKTRKPILLNKENLGSGDIKRLMQAFVKEGNNKIKLSDPFGKVVDSALITINDFASFAGSFVLPKSAATGGWKVGNSKNYNAENAGRFRVEEYKRPTIELSMEKQQKMLVPGERIDVQLKVRAFSGATLNNTPITYSVTRNFYHPWDIQRGKLYAEVPAMLKLADTTLYTDQKGKVSFAIDDSLLRKLAINDNQEYQIRYSITARAVDATGESTEMDESIGVSSRPVTIVADVAESYDRQVLPKLSVETRNSLEGMLARPVHVQLFRTGASSTDTSQNKTLVLDTVVHTGKNGSVPLLKENVSTGYFHLVLSTRDDDKTLGQAEFTFSVFDSKSTAIPEEDVDYIAVSTAKTGDVITWYSSGKKDNYTIYQALYNDGKDAQKIRSTYITQTEEPGLRTWTFRVPERIVGELLLQRISVKDNKIHRFTKEISIEREDLIEAPILVVEKYRSILAPGAEERVKISLKTKDTRVASELLTTIYDASLDKLNMHQWHLPDVNAPLVYPQNSWNYTIANSRHKGDAAANQVWIYPRRYETKGMETLLEGRAMGLGVDEKSVLNEVVVVGYGQRTQNIRIRGNMNLARNKQALVIVDGRVYAGDLNSLNPSLIRDMIVLKDAEALAIYGSKAAQGVIIISTTGKIMLPGIEAVPVKIRRNFNETAFFTPDLRADQDGNFSFSYTMPESATAWNWKMLAHTSKGAFAYLEKTIQTQLSLMIQLHTPRLIYQGDQLQLQSRISNLDTLVINGHAKLKIEDAVTGDDLTAILTTKNSVPFSVKGQGSTAITYDLRIPEKQTNPLKVIITALSGAFSDAEEHILPVLSTRVFLRQQQMLHNNGQESKIITPVQLPADADLEGLSISIAQKPSASLLYALPWLANGSFNGAEQVFDKLKAQVTAMSLLYKDTSLRAAFGKAVTVGTVKDDSTIVLPKEITSDLIPWLGLNTHVSTQQRALRELLDSVNASRQVAQQLDKLYKLQQSSGGLAWFNGGQPNVDVTAYVLAGFGRLQSNFTLMKLNNDPQFDTFIQKLLDDQLQIITKGKTGVYSSGDRLTSETED